jgi:transcriptional regulator with XRE-family HTH domain
MTAKPTPGGAWLRAQRQALGLTAAALGDALGVKGQTIAAIECGARALTPALRARAEAYFRDGKAAGLATPPPPGRVYAEAWVMPETVTAALAEASRREMDVELVLGEWADRPRPDLESLERVVIGALRSAIHDHGPITPEWIGSAAKRILGQLVNARSPTVGG